MVLPAFDPEKERTPRAEACHDEALPLTLAVIASREATGLKLRAIEAIVVYGGSW